MSEETEREVCLDWHREKEAYDMQREESDPTGIVEQLRAFADEQKESARVRKDREMYQFYGGYLAALERVKALIRSRPSPDEHL